MTKPKVVVPPVVRRKAAQLGDAGAAWLSGLPDLIEDLERLWSITFGAPLSGGTASYVARARTVMAASTPSSKTSTQIWC